MEQLADALRMLLVVFGVGLVIFVHEAGHFIAARWCKVRVEVFSIGFGPRIFGWKRGETRYQLSAIPLGGYVKMAGEETTDPADGPPDPGDLMSKSVGQRFFIYSGGVLMNLAFGFVVFPILFAVGVPFIRPVLGDVIPGGPAWHAGLEPGTEVLSVDGKRVFDFLHIPTAVAIGEEEHVELEVRPPGATEPRTVQLEALYDEGNGFYSIDVRAPYDPEHKLSVTEGSPAWDAGLRTGDRLLGVVGGLQGLDPTEQFVVATGDRQPVRLRIGNADGSGEREVLLAPRLDEEHARVQFGLLTPCNHVAALRRARPPTGLGLEVDDRLLEVDGRTILRQGDLRRAVLDGQGPLAMRVLRDGRVVRIASPEADRGRLLAQLDDLAVVHDAETTRLVVEPGAGRDAGLRDGDRVLTLDDQPVEGWAEFLGRAREAARTGEALAFTIERTVEEGALRQLEVTVAPEPAPVPDYGIVLEQDTYLYQTKGPAEAIQVGVACSWKFVEDTWLTLKNTLTGRVSSEHLGGFITIGTVSYRWSQAGLAKLFFFLCMLSINLAIINVLPIPVLDGGHLMFLVVEKLKGSPVSDRVLAYSQMVGLVLILSLMVYVTYNDIVRWILPG